MSRSCVREVNSLACRDPTGPEAKYPWVQWMFDKTAPTFHGKNMYLTCLFRTIPCYFSLRPQPALYLTTASRDLAFSFKNKARTPVIFIMAWLFRKCRLQDMKQKGEAKISSQQFVLAVCRWLSFIKLKTHCLLECWTPCPHKAAGGWGGKRLV